ncbi:MULTISPECIES: hypothetical protein [unclassified Streptomyces]|uniref:hypothetical protein n=1 Tax=unclassified Streptomyces TaxID=2593676 RepID=UPI0034178F1A
MAEMFPATDRLTLAYQATSGLVPFDLDPSVLTWCVAVVALGPNCAPLGGRAPDLELRAGTGLITLVPHAPATVPITDENGIEAATASWQRDPRDVFTMTLTASDLRARTWSLRITNNDPQELGFVWSSGAAPDVHQPRIALGRTALQSTVAVADTLPPDTLVPISNIGTGPLNIVAQGGQDIGAGYQLKEFPKGLAPNECSQLKIGVVPATDPPDSNTQTASFTLNCNDPVTQEITLQLSRTEKHKEHKDQKDVGKEHKEEKDGKDHKDHKDDNDNKIGNKEHPAEIIHPASEAGSPPEHFIPPAQRPDLTDSALRDEPPEPGPGPAEG